MEGKEQMSSILRYLVIGTAMLALSLSAACKEDASPAAKEVSAGAEAGATAGAQEGVQAGMEGGAKEGAKEGGTAAGEAAASEVVN
jgi:flagellar biosynthesis/type III secretory pathway protein FliH